MLNQRSCYKQKAVGGCANTFSLFIISLSTFLVPDKYKVPLAVKKKEIASNKMTS